MRKEEVLDGLRRETEEMPKRWWAPGAVVGVIGGLGEMGRLFSRFFVDLGYTVKVADRGTEYTNREAIEDADIVLFAVPLHQTVEIIRDLVPYTRPDQLLMDVTSLKVAPVKEMLCSQASVVGLHPMFGGRVKTLDGQTLVACPVRIDREKWLILRKFFIDVGIRVKESTPEEHDRMMSIIQVLLHMTTMLKGRVLRELGVDIAETMAYTSPSYRLEINLLGRMFAQSPALYSAIAEMNPYTKDILAQLKAGLESYETWYSSGDLSAFMNDFEHSAAHLGEFCRSAYDESSAYLDFVVQTANHKTAAVKK
ncbi:MAG: prephenate dehydrogenase/arogenate dehydrogenase family protein [Syntrophobacteraceae bacterium]